MRNAGTWQPEWSADGVSLTRVHENAAPQESRFLTNAEIATLNDYDAVMFGLPRHMEAMMVVEIEGRIDHPAFQVHCRLEPFTHLHPWAVYHREGARIFVGERQFRLNTAQFVLFNALDAMREARADVAARLRRWPALVAALQTHRRARIVVLGLIPFLQITPVAEWPLAALTRTGNQLWRAGEGHAEWAMLPYQKYFLRGVALS